MCSPKLKTKREEKGRRKVHHSAKSHTRQCLLSTTSCKTRNARVSSCFKHDFKSRTNTTHPSAMSTDLRQAAGENVVMISAQPKVLSLCTSKCIPLRAPSGVVRSTITQTQDQTRLSHVSRDGALRSHAQRCRSHLACAAGPQCSGTSASLNTSKEQ